MGARACIGFQFAFLEAKLVLARFAQRYVARPVDPNYVLRDIQALTMKPDHLEMVLEHRPEVKGRFPTPSDAQEKQAPAAVVGDRPMIVLYGSNMGGSRDIATDVARRAGKRGFAATVRELDEQLGKPWLTTGPVVIVTSTYNGTPPDNAVRFATYLDRAAPDACRGVQYAVLGCGNKQWRQTFQKFPIQIDEKLKSLGAEPFLPIGAADADSDFESAVENWTAALTIALETFVTGRETTVEPDHGAETALRVEIIDATEGNTGGTPMSRIKLDEDSLLSVMQVNRELQAAGSPGSTRHIEIPLPGSATYAAGDHLGVFPENPPALVEAVAKRSGMTPSTTVLLSSVGPDGSGVSGLPLGLPISVGEILTHYVDLAGPVTRRELRAWAKAADCPADKLRLDRWLADFAGVISESKPAMMDLLDQVPSVRVDLATLLTLRPSLKPRYYSISSSPLVSRDHCSLTVGVQRFKCADGVERAGLCSSYLAGLAEGMTVRVVVKDTGSSFRLPADASLPVILVGPGTGLAPLRGFIQERRALRGRGAKVGRTALFFGCRGAEDHLYREELESYRADRTLSLLDVAFSRLPDRPKTYVQDSIRRHAAELLSMVQDGGSIFVCGNAHGMAPGVRRAFSEILGGEAEVEKLESDGRYLQDVWAAG
jgi:cytochrome P450/NADPH-cytochrome P450 reductase